MSAKLGAPFQSGKLRQAEIVDEVDDATLKCVLCSSCHVRRSSSSVRVGEAKAFIRGEDGS